MNNCNPDIRKMISNYGLTFTEVAEEMNIKRNSFSHLMAKPLSTKSRIKILTAIDRLTGGTTYEKPHKYTIDELKVLFEEVSGKTANENMLKMLEAIKNALNAGYCADDLIKVFEYVIAEKTKTGRS